jgi:quinol monooxygenase YgiN
VVAEPFIFIGTYELKEGKRDEFTRYWRDFVEFVEESEPRLIAFNAYVNDDGNEVAVVQVHPDVDSMEFHMKLIREHVEHAAWEFLGDTVSTHIYGAPSESALETMGQLGSSGFVVKPHGIGGFTRSAAEQAAVAG